MNFGPYPAIVRDWHDGDTCHIDVDLGFANYELSHDLEGKPILSCRIYGINAPELSTDAGKVALAYAEQICPAGTKVVVLSHGWDKYGGRFDGTITLPQALTAGDYTGTDYASLMLSSGNAVVFT